MSGSDSRVLSARGSARDVGLTLGRAVGERLRTSIETYIGRRLGEDSRTDGDVRRRACDWLAGLPRRFQEEIEGLSSGSGVPMAQLADWCYLEAYLAGGCTTVVGRLGSRTWLARNNDFLPVPLWGYATIRAVDGLIPTLSLGMEAEPFTITGVNAARLWLHQHYLPACGAVVDSHAALPSYVWLPSALEQSRSLADVEHMLVDVPRADGMMLFAVDGARDEASVFYCDRSRHTRQDLREGWLVGANHRPGQPTDDGESVSRYERARSLVAALADGGEPPVALRAVLADDGIEQRAADSGTVYAAVACPGTGELWFTCGGFPAASKGDWQHLAWPWDD